MITRVSLDLRASSADRCGRCSGGAYTQQRISMQARNVLYSACASVVQVIPRHAEPRRVPAATLWRPELPRPGAGLAGAFLLSFEGRAVVSERCSMGEWCGSRRWPGRGHRFHYPALWMAAACSSRRQCPRAICTCCSGQRSGLPVPGSGPCCPGCPLFVPSRCARHSPCTRGVRRADNCAAGRGRSLLWDGMQRARPRANGHRHQASSGHGQRVSPQAEGPSGDAQRRLATGGARLTSEGPVVRTHLRPPVYAGQRPL
jgi:hypothetical protein